MYKLSIITINLNNARGLKETIESVINQSYTDFEYIIIDGASTDGSVDLIKEYADKITYWVSEPDTGIYNAMNKGILKSNGEYLLMLNSGDIFHSTSILESVLLSEFVEDVLYGNVIWKSNDKIEDVSRLPSTLRFSYFVNASLFHQALFIKRILHDKIGFYDENHRIISDWCFLILAICKYNCSYRYIDKVITVCDRDGISCILENQDNILKERTSFLQLEFRAFYSDYLEYQYLIDNKNKNLLFKIQRIIRKIIRV